MSPDSPPAAVPAPDLPASTPPIQPGLIELFVAFAKMSLAGFGGVLVLGAAQHRRAAPLDDGGGIQRDLRAVPFSAGAEHRQPVGRVRLALSRDCRRHRGLRRAGRSADGDRRRSWRRSMPATARSTPCGASWPGCPVRRSGFCCNRDAHDDAADQEARSGRAAAAGRGVHRDRAAAAAAASGVAGGDPAQHRHHLLSCGGGRRHEFGCQPDLDAGLDLRVDVAVCGRRRQFGDSGNAPHRGRRSALDDATSNSPTCSRFRRCRRGRTC